MHCPFCHHPDSRVVDTRIADDGASIRRRRECLECKRRFTTIETSSFQVAKNSGTIEPFSRDKVIAGVRKACHGRPVSDRDLALLAQQVEESLRLSGVSSVSSKEVGKAILPYLSRLDEVAFLRFASVYRSYDNLEDFENAIIELRELRNEENSGNGTSQSSGSHDSLLTDHVGTSSLKKQMMGADAQGGQVAQLRSEVTPHGGDISRRTNKRKAVKKRVTVMDEPTLLDT